MKFDIKKLCTPAYVYLVISMISIILMIIQNAGNTNTYCLGNYACMVSNTAWVFAGKAFYVVLWTYILNLICSYGYRNISWFLVLFPFVLFFILIGLFMLNQGVFMLQQSSLYGGLREGLENMEEENKEEEKKESFESFESMVEGAAPKAPAPKAAAPKAPAPKAPAPKAPAPKAPAPKAPAPKAPAPKAAPKPAAPKKAGFQTMNPAPYHN
jgi:hypothetical protein